MCFLCGLGQAGQQQQKNHTKKEKKTKKTFAARGSDDQIVWMADGRTVSALTHRWRWAVRTETLPERLGETRARFPPPPIRRRLPGPGALRLRPPLSPLTFKIITAALQLVLPCGLWSWRGGGRLMRNTHLHEFLSCRICLLHARRLVFSACMPAGQMAE